MLCFCHYYLCLYRSVACRLTSCISIFPCFPYLSGSLGVHEGETNLFDDAVAPSHTWFPSSSFALQSTLDRIALQRSPSFPALSGSLGVHEGGTSPSGDLSLHCNVCLPLPHLPSTKPFIRSRCIESCLMVCPANDSFLTKMISNNDLPIVTHLCL